MKHSKNDIENIAFNILKDSKSLDVFPTPVNKIFTHCELIHDKSIDLSKVHPGFFTKNLEVLKKALRKVRGMIDIQEKIVYTDLNVSKEREKFIKLHETGHKVIPWQNKSYGYADDDKTLSPTTMEIYEQEANYFASSSLFQLDRYEEEALKLPLSIKSAMYLADKFGSSKHASIRRYVEYSKKRCALLVLENYDKAKNIATQRDYFQSNKFTEEFGEISWPKTLNNNFPFIFNLYLGRRLVEDGQIPIELNGKIITLSYHLFNNTYNSFIFLFPAGEYNKSRTRIYIKK